MRYQRAEQPVRLDGFAAARDFFAGCFAESDPARETLWVAHLDEAGDCVHLSRHEGDEAGAGLPIRTIVVDAALHSSAALLLSHNHPSGDPQPSSADQLATRKLAGVMAALDCRLVDHIVFGGGNCASFRQLGLL